VARAWHERGGFRARLTLADLTEAEPRRISVVVSSSDEVIRVVREWLRSYDEARDQRG
jgi:hypothetical protein